MIERLTLRLYEGDEMNIKPIKTKADYLLTVSAR